MWLVVVIIAYFFTALANLVDKILLARYIDRPLVYAFFIGVLSIVALVLVPFGFVLPGLEILILGLIAGATFIVALYFFFSALRLGEASKVIPFVGGLSPIFVFLFSWFALNIKTRGSEFVAFIFLLLGIYFISRDSFRKKSHTKENLIFSSLAALTFAFYYTLSKYIYLNESFINGFISIAFGTFLSALSLLLWPKNRKLIFQSFEARKTPASVLFFFGQGSGAIGSLLTSYAISLANVTLVNALQGLQFTFLLIMVIILGKKYPHLLEEKLTGRVLLEKVLAIFFIGVGLVVLAIK
jgi:drug/metabolite transporter (DMT)-like permease